MATNHIGHSPLCRTFQPGKGFFFRSDPNVPAIAHYGPWLWVPERGQCNLEIADGYARLAALIGLDPTVVSPGAI